MTLEYNRLFPNITIITINTFHIKHTITFLLDKSYTYFTNWLSSILTCEEINECTKFKTLKRLSEWLSGRIAAKKAVSHFSNTSLNKIQINKKTSGAPEIRGHPVWPVSITHSNEYAVAALSTDINQKLGVDIEYIDGIKPSEFISIAFSRKEILELKNQPTDMIYMNWTKKEAYLKYIEKGFAEKLKSIEILNNKIYHNSNKVNNITTCSSKIFQNYYITLIVKRHECNSQFQH
jgi:4'-phosphopantetheinyl transferase